MKQYQDHDPIADQGKATPHPKQPTRYTYRGSRFGTPVTMGADELKAHRASKAPGVKGKATIRQKFSIAGAVALILARFRKPR